MKLLPVYLRRYAYNQGYGPPKSYAGHKGTYKKPFTANNGNNSSVVGMTVIKILVASAIIFSILSCSSKESQIDKMFPADQVKGAITKLDATVNEQTGKGVKGGRLVEALVTVPFDIKREQIRPSMIGVLKVLMNKYPDCEWFTISMSFGKDVPLLTAGQAEYKEGKIQIQYGVPSDKELEEWNLIVKNYPRSILVKQDSATYKQGAEIIKRYYALNNDKSEKKIRSLHDIFAIISKEKGIPIEEVDRLYTQVGNYFTLNWGKEEYRIK